MTIENNKNNCNDSICRSLARTADWRKNLQIRFPTDPRNGRAAITLARLANEVDGLTDDEWSALKSHYCWTSERWSNAVSEASRRVEFQRNIRTFPAFVEDLTHILSAAN
jgi:hypothetical protein